MKGGPKSSLRPSSISSSSKPASQQTVIVGGGYNVVLVATRDNYI